MTKARDEFAHGVMRNEHVQTATANAASAAVQSQINNMSNPAPNSTSPRF